LLPFDTMAAREEALADSFLGEGLERAYMELAGLSAKDARDLSTQQGLEGWTTHRTYRFLQERANGRMLVDKSPSYAADIANADRADAWFEVAEVRVVGPPSLRGDRVDGASPVPHHVGRGRFRSARVRRTRLVGR
jgi:hypothetical protein